MANQAVANIFKVSKSNLHQITSGRKYAGRSITTDPKLKCVQELENYGEQMVKIAKVKPKPKPKSQKMVTVMKMTPKIILLPFLEEPTGEPRRSRRKKDKDKKDNDEEPMVHLVISIRGTLRCIQRDLKNPEVFKERSHEEVRSRHNSNNSGEL